MISPMTIDHQLKLATVFRWAILGKYDRAEAELNAANLGPDELVPVMMAANWIWQQARDRIVDPIPPSHGTEKEREVGGSY